MSVTTKIANADDLQKAIKELEKKVEKQQFVLKENYLQVKENLQPKRVLKNTFSYLAETPEIQKTLVNTVIGFILGYASKKATELLTEENIDRTVYNIVNTHISQIENKEPGSLLSKGITLFRKHTPPDSPIYPFVKYK